jgi:DNA-binding GntR family transcriptional regulator
VNPGTEPASLKKTAYQFIQTKILGGQLSAGEAVSELAISRELRISRTPVREAIGQLAAEGLIEQIAGHGSVVKRPTRVDILELYELREALEVYAVGKASQHPIDPGEQVQLDRLCAEFLALADELDAGGERWLQGPQMQRSVAADFQFHLLLLRAAGNWRIVRVVSDTRVLIRIFAIRREQHDARLLRKIHDYHKRILDSVREGDASGAMQVMGEHIRKSCEERLIDFDRWEWTSRIDVDYPAHFALEEWNDPNGRNES